MNRPRPPEDLDELLGDFRPAPELRDWVRETFLDRDSSLFNPEHVHLRQARIGFLWTTVPCSSKGRTVLGSAEMPSPRGRLWIKSRQEHQIRQWFDTEPDFLVTIFAPFAAEAEDAAFCALLEHEMYHCGQATDEFGAPRFRKSDGRPIWTVRGHDVEKFVGVVRRYGARASGRATGELVRAGSRDPEVGVAEIAGACGTCGAGV